MGDGSDNFTFLFDDIRLTTSTLAGYQELQNVRLYQSDNLLNVNGDNNLINSTIEIFDINGRKIKCQNQLRFSNGFEINQ